VQGGIVIVQVKRMAKRGTLHGKHVRIPGILVDFVVVDHAQRQTYATYYDPSYSGELRIPNDAITQLPLGPRKVIVRRAAMELFPGAICNLGAGVSTGLSTIAAEEGVLDAAILTNEQGIIGGAPITGRDSGGGQNFAAMIEQPSQFDFYDGGGLDLAFLVVRRGRPRGQRQRQPLRRPDHRRRRLHQHRPERALRGVQRHADRGRARRRVGNGRTVIRKEGKHRKFVRSSSRSATTRRSAGKRGQVTLFVTERAVFRVGADGLELCEIAPGARCGARRDRAHGLSAGDRDGPEDDGRAHLPARAHGTRGRHREEAARLSLEARRQVARVARQGGRVSASASPARRGSTRSWAIRSRR
jgi:propionate CoA-transferase